MMKCGTISLFHLLTKAKKHKNKHIQSLQVDIRTSRKDEWGKAEERLDKSSVSISGSM